MRISQLWTSTACLPAAIYFCSVLEMATTAKTQLEQCLLGLVLHAWSILWQIRSASSPPAMCAARRPLFSSTTRSTSAQLLMSVALRSQLYG
jgi:hypothetical protein